MRLSFRVMRTVRVSPLYGGEEKLDVWQPVESYVLGASVPLCV